MKDVKRVSLMTLIGFAVALLIYPCLHEGGHALATLLLGGKCVDIHILPLPYMICDAAGIETRELVTIGMSGVLLPLFFAVALRGKNFYVWYTRLLLRGITVFSLLIALAVVALREFGITVPNDDVTEILHLWQSGAVWIAAGSLSLCTIMILLIARDRPIKRIIAQLA